MIRSQNLQGISEFLQLALNVLQDVQHMSYEYSIHILLYRMSSFDLLAFIQNKQWDRLEKIVAAAQSCPVVAIAVYQKGRRLYPKQKKK